MQIQGFTFNPLSENTYIIWCENTLACAIVDAGMYNSSEYHQVQQFIEDRQLQPQLLLGTHGHIDHIFGNWWVKQQYNLPYYLHKDDIAMIERSTTMADLWNLAYTPSPLPDVFLEHGNILKLGDLDLEVRFVPGHAPGHVIFIHHNSKQVLVGDTIFQGSIGRTDLPGGNHELLLQKIQSEIFSLPDDFQLFSGHGPATTVGFEKLHNPFF